MRRVLSVVSSTRTLRTYVLKRVEQTLVRTIEKEKCQQIHQELFI